MTPALSIAQAVYQIILEKPGAVRGTRRSLNNIHGAGGDYIYQCADALLEDENVHTVCQMFADKIHQQAAGAERAYWAEQRLYGQIAELKAELEELREKAEAYDRIAASNAKNGKRSGSNMTAEERKERAKKAAAARWSK